MAHVCFTFAIIAMLVMSQGVSAKRGCSAFGHSCFGGHGKRSLAIDPANGDMMDRQVGQAETPPHPGYPRSGYVPLPSGDDIIPVRDGGIYDREDAATREMMKYKLRNIVKHWMDQYRRSQQNDEGYVVDSL